jgi:hypothetical protein
MTRVIVHIDRLVLNGLRPEDQQPIAEGLQGELGRLLQTPGVAEQLASMRSQARMRTDGIAHPQEGKPEQFGASVASNIVRNFNR